MRRVRRHTTTAATVCAAVVAALAATLVSHGKATALSVPTLTVTQNLLPGLANATDLGPPAPSTVLNLQVTLPRPNPDGERSLLDAEHDPSSPSFGQFLSVDDFASRFGVPQSEV